MEENKLKLLSEFLGEHYHIISEYWKCSCGESFSRSSDRIKHEQLNRTFSAEADLMALYRRIWSDEGKFKEDKFYKFHNYAFDVWEADVSLPEDEMHTFSAWLFCLSGSGYEERAEMICEWLEEVK